MSTYPWYGTCPTYPTSPTCPIIQWHLMIFISAPMYLQQIYPEFTITWPCPEMIPLTKLCLSSGALEQWKSSSWTRGCMESYGDWSGLGRLKKISSCREILPGMQVSIQDHWINMYYVDSFWISLLISRFPVYFCCHLCLMSSCFVLMCNVFSWCMNDVSRYIHSVLLAKGGNVLTYSRTVV